MPDIGSPSPRGIADITAVRVCLIWRMYDIGDTLLLRLLRSENWITVSRSTPHLTALPTRPNNRR